MVESINSKNRSLIIGTITYAIGNFGTKILSFLIVPLYTFYIMPSDLGDYDLLMTTVSLLSPLLTMKISDATYRWLIRDVSNSPDYLGATYKLLFRNCILFSIVLIVLNQIIPIWNCYYFIFILIGDRILECIQKLLRGLKNQKLFAVSGIVYTGLLVSANFIKICILHQGVIALLQSVIFAQTLTILFVLWKEKSLKIVNWRNWSKHKQLQKDFLKYSVPLVPSALSWWVMSASDRYVIRLILGKAANGIFAVAGKFPSILQTIFTMFNNAWTDMALAELGKGDQTEEYVASVFRRLYCFSFSVVFGLIPLTKIVTQVILGPNYQSASIYIGILYLGTIFQGFSSFCSIGYLQQKTTAGAARTSIYGAIVNLIVDVFTMKYIGLFAASISTFAGFFVMWIARMHDIKNSFPIRIKKLEFVLYLLVAIALAMGSIWSNLEVDVVLLIGATVWFFYSNKDIIKKIVSKRIKTRVGKEL